MSNEELKPCPFCGEAPEYPSGDGTQYELECDCGMAHSSVQISDLMTIEERMEDNFTDYRYGAVYIQRAKKEVVEYWNTRAPITREQVNEWCKNNFMAVVDVSATLSQRKIHDEHTSLRYPQANEHYRFDHYWKAMIRAAQESRDGQ
jgi:hypothetical protein